MFHHLLTNVVLIIGKNEYCLKGNTHIHTHCDVCVCVCVCDSNVCFRACSRWSPGSRYAADVTQPVAACHQCFATNYTSLLNVLERFAKPNLTTKPKYVKQNEKWSE